MRKPARKQIHFEDIAIEEIMKDEDFYLPLLELVDFEKLMKPYRKIYSDLGRGSYPIETGMKCTLVQIFENKSDRQMEKLVKYDIRIRYFCGLGLDVNTPDHTYFCRYRDRFGAENIKRIHDYVIKVLENANIVGNFCSFVDTSEIVRKFNTWKERDKKIEEEIDKINIDRDLRKKEPLQKKKELKYEKNLINNGNISKYNADPDARIGCKGNKKFWFGYKRGVCVDSKFEIITKVDVKPANVPDHNFAIDLLPDNGAVLMDKGFDVDKIIDEAPDNATLRIIKKRNRKDKDHDFDRWISSIRAPFESIFSRLEKRTRRVGLLRNIFKGYIEAIAHNLKKVLNLKKIYADRFSNLSIA